MKRAQAYYASENLSSACGYEIDQRERDKTPERLTIHQIVQPVIHVSADARSAKIRARLFQLGGPAGGDGSWSSGIYENSSADEGGTWKLTATDLIQTWTAPSHGGWARAIRPSAVPFHYRNPVSGRVPPLLVP